MYTQRLFAEKDRIRIPFDLAIHDPVPFEGSETEYCCQIEATGLFVRPKRIHGEGAQQAADLAGRFVNTRLASIAVYDESGQRVLNIGRGKAL